MRRKEKSCEKAAGCRTCKRGLVADSALDDAVRRELLSISPMAVDTMRRLTKRWVTRFTYHSNNV